MTPAAIISRIRALGVSIRLTAAGTVTTRPKGRVPDDLRTALAEQIPEVIKLLEKERRPNERAEGDTRPRLSGVVRDLKEDGANVWPVIQKANDPPYIFTRGGALIATERDDDGRLFVRPLNVPRLTHYLAQIGYFTVERYQGDIVAEMPAPPPRLLVADLLATPEPPLPVLDRIVATPIVTPSGIVHDAPGYDAASRCIYAPPDSVDIPPLPRAPSPAQLKAAVEVLFEPFRDFPFVGEADRAHTVAAIITIVARALIAAPTPLFLWMKPSPGTGASLLVKAIMLIATGTDAAMLTEADESEEWRKRLTAALMEAPAAICFDNLTGHLDNAHLSAALTSDVWSDRIMGRHETVRLPIRNAWFGTGNNVTLSTDIRRRTVMVKLDSKVERPWLRERDGLVTFRHPDLARWVAEHRAELVHAALTLVMAWLAAGRPPGTVTMGSYEAWAHVVGGILQTAGIKGFLSNLEEIYEEVDVETEEGKRFVRRWWQDHGEHSMTPRDLFVVASHDDVGLPLHGKDDVGRVASLGHWLSKHAGRCYDLEKGLTLSIKRERGEHRSLWRLTRPKPAMPDRAAAGSAGFADSFASECTRSGESVTARIASGEVTEVENPANPADHALEREPGEDFLGANVPLPCVPQACWTCNGTRFWQSHVGVITCASCHPPAVETLVAQRLEP